MDSREIEWMEMMTSCAGAAALVQEEPHVYSALRLIEVLEKMIRYGEKYQLTNKEELVKIADTIAVEKYKCMTETDAFNELLENTAISLMNLNDC